MVVAASSLAELHTAGAWVVVVGNGLAGAWALAAHRWPSARVAALWWFTIAAQVAIFVVVGLGVAYQNAEGLEPTQFHTLYGFASLFAVGIIYSYRNQLQGKLHLLYGLGGLFLMGMGIRAMILHR